MANVELLLRTLERIEDNPGQWKQGDWSMCFAGQALREAGAVDDEPASCDCHRPLVLDGEAYQGYDIGIRAAALLELDPFTVGLPRLFSSDNTLSDLRRLVTEIITQESADAADAVQS